VGLEPALGERRLLGDLERDEVRGGDGGGEGVVLGAQIADLGLELANSLLQPPYLEDHPGIVATYVAE
jgi:hypothetical protein